MNVGSKIMASLPSLRNQLFASHLLIGMSFTLNIPQCYVAWAGHLRVPKSRWHSA